MKKHNEFTLCCLSCIGCKEPALVTVHRPYTTDLSCDSVTMWLLWQSSGCAVGLGSGEWWWRRRGRGDSRGSPTAAVHSPGSVGGEGASLAPSVAGCPHHYCTERLQHHENHQCLKCLILCTLHCLVSICLCWMTLGEDQRRSWYYWHLIHWVSAASAANIYTVLRNSCYTAPCEQNYELCVWVWFGPHVTLACAAWMAFDVLRPSCKTNVTLPVIITALLYSETSDSGPLIVDLW